MAWDEEEDTRTFKVLVDRKKRYQIWPIRKQNPVGWVEEGKCGLKKDCLAYIEEVWTDRPLRRNPGRSLDAPDKAAW